MPNIHSLEDVDSGIAPQTLVQVTMAHIQGDDPCRPGLQKTIGKSTRSRPDVDTDLVLDRDVKGLKGCLKLDATPANERVFRTDDRNRRPRCDQGPRLINSLTIHAHLAGKDDPPCALSALD